jgi:hypothetical protein
VDLVALAGTRKPLFKTADHQRGGVADQAAKAVVQPTVQRSNSGAAELPGGLEQDRRRTEPGHQEPPGSAVRTNGQAAKGSATTTAPGAKQPVQQRATSVQGDASLYTRTTTRTAGATGSAGRVDHKEEDYFAFLDEPTPTLAGAATQTGGEQAPPAMKPTSADKDKKGKRKKGSLANCSADKPQKSESSPKVRPPAQPMRLCKGSRPAAAILAWLLNTLAADGDAGRTFVRVVDAKRRVAIKMTKLVAVTGLTEEEVRDGLNRLREQVLVTTEVRKDQGKKRTFIQVNRKAARLAYAAR